jgi:hypothetical protein
MPALKPARETPPEVPQNGHPNGRLYKLISTAVDLNFELPRRGRSVLRVRDEFLAMFSTRQNSLTGFCRVFSIARNSWGSKIGDTFFQTQVVVLANYNDIAFENMSV